MTREFLQMALEALENYAQFGATAKAQAAITAIKEALAQPFKPDYNTEAVLVEEMQRMAKRIEDLEVEHEPVAWMTRDDGDGLWYSTNFKKSDDDRPLYTSPPPCPTCEALARTVMLDQTSHDIKREWVGLTDEEVVDLYDFAYANDKEFVRNVEAKLKEKNQ
jgi:hypothetical protein